MGSSRCRYVSCTCRSCRPLKKPGYSSRTSNEYSSSTYGTYIYPAKTRRYSTADHRDCDCDCCPHSYPSAASPLYRDTPPARESRYSHPAGRAYSYPRHDDCRDDGDRWWSPPSSSYAGYDRSSHPAKPQSPRSRVASGRSFIDVADKTADSSLRRRYGGVFILSLASYAAVDNILDFLAPNPRRHKVLVYWENGQVEQLDNQIPLRDVRRYAAQLEVRDTKKRVHWS